MLSEQDSPLYSPRPLPLRQPQPLRPYSVAGGLREASLDFLRVDWRDEAVAGAQTLLEKNSVLSPMLLAGRLPLGMMRRVALESLQIGGAALPV